MLHNNIITTRISISLQSRYREFSSPQASLLLLFPNVHPLLSLPAPLLHLSTWTLAITNLFSISTILLFQKCYLNELIKYVKLWDWLFLTELNSLSTYLSSCMYQLFLSIAVVVVFLAKDVSHFVYSFACGKIQIVCSVWRLQRKLLCILVHRFLCGHSFQVSGINAQECNCWVGW